MNLSCSSVIKAENVSLKGRKVVRNLPESKPNTEEVETNIESQEALIRAEEEIRLKLEEAQIKYEEIINNARIESETLINQTKEEVVNIEKKAYEQGYSQGTKNGYEDGYKEAYEDNIEKAKQESEEIIQAANNILLESNNQVVEYMKENKSNILNISVSIAEQILRERFDDESSMDDLLVNIIKEYELKQNFVIKTNPLYKDSVDAQILKLKEEYKINTDVFVICDESIQNGNAIIDNEKGKLVVGIDSVLDKIKEELL